MGRSDTILARTMQPEAWGHIYNIIYLHISASILTIGSQISSSILTIGGQISAPNIPMNTMTESEKQIYRIAGLVYHVEVSESECGKFDGFIEPEPSNPHDPNAMVIKKSDGRTVGYIQREKVEMFCVVNGRRRVPCEITISGRKEDGVLVYIEGYVRPTTTTTFLFPGAVPLGNGDNVMPSGTTPQSPLPTTPRRPRHARTGQQEAVRTAQKMNREPLPADASQGSLVSQKSSQKSKTQSKSQPKRPRLTTTTRPLTTSTGNNPQAVSDNRNVSPLSSFERFLFIMIVVALLLVLAHLLS